jgi:hypothetical protein
MLSFNATGTPASAPTGLPAFNVGVYLLSSCASLIGGHQIECVNFAFALGDARKVLLKYFDCRRFARSNVCSNVNDGGENGFVITVHLNPATAERGNDHLLPQVQHPALRHGQDQQQQRLRGTRSSSETAEQAAHIAEVELVDVGKVVEHARSCVVISASSSSLKCRLDKLGHFGHYFCR